MSTVDELEKRWLREGARDDKEFENFTNRRKGGEPVHRILGWREFWGLKFYLSRETLEPRPDSETMIEVLLRTYQHKQAPLRMLDMGTGTGCLLMAALSEFPNATGIGIDVFAGAVATAQKNASLLGFEDRAAFHQINWYKTDDLKALGQFDIILANPPYIPHADISKLQIEVREYDPIAALDGGLDGLDAYRHIISQLNHVLNPRGITLFEIGYDQAHAVQTILQEAGMLPSPAYADLGGNPRVITAQF